MVVLEYVSTIMASLASPVSTGSATVSSSGHFEGLERVSLSKNVHSFHKIWVKKRGRVCKYSVTDYIADQGTSVSLNSTYEGSKHNAAVVVLKAAPKPVLRSGSKTEPLLNINSISSMPWNLSKLNEDSEYEKVHDDKEEIDKVIESLGEALEKAEKLESIKKVSPVNKSPLNISTDKRKGKPKNGKPVNLTVGRKSKTLKSVWRKGDTVASVQKSVKESPKTQKVEKKEPRIEGAGKVESPPIFPLRPLKPPIKPSIAPPPVIKKSVILKDVGAPPNNRATGGNNLVAKERKPMLIDKFAAKKLVVDPLIAQAVLTPPKSAKGPIPGKFKDEFRKKSGPLGGPRRQMVKNVEIPDEETSELDVSIPGAATARKGRKWSKASRKAARLQAAKEAAPIKEEILEVGEEGMSTEELAHNLAISEGEIFGYLSSMGIKPDGVQTFDKNMVKMICKEYEVEVIDAAPVRVEEMAKKKEILDEEDLENLEDRPPVLTIMGHVDHGKTTLLDYIRKSKVAASEAGGITQGIGAYKVLIPIDGKFQPCVFLDTPGHEAFGAMRARGAKVTDIAIIIVAADDGIRPQTNEAIAHAKAAGVPIVIAINKIDKHGANPERVMQELSSIGLMPEDWGGDIPMVQISALKGENIDELLEIVMLVAELQELKANPHRSARGTVIEAGLHKSKGPVATFIVQNGTLKRGDIVVCGEAFGKVRSLSDDVENRVDEAGPSIPVQVIGLNNVPIAGDEFEVVGSLKVARARAESRAESLKNERISAKTGDGKVTLSSFASAGSAGKQAGLLLHQLNIIMKVDVQGSIEAVRQALKVLPQDNVTLKFLFQATGDVSTSDVDLAVASKGIILGFNVKAPGSVKSYADNKGVEIRQYRVVYELIDDVRNAMEGLLEPVEEQETIGAAEVRAIFSSGSGHIAGCMVTEGEVVKDCGIRVVRNGKTIYIGILHSLRRVKEIVKEVNAGLECGIRTEDFSDWEVGDILEAFKMVQKKQTLEKASAAIEAALKGVGIEL
ncbi:translation initiation factor IF-2, chloroplastic-like [Cornus florida]|uniref:translation initiation factor IF-2, chloroplastic-like n=1 Tax=Cornus florida TaxID=4283 RepID=UPI0028A26E7C|nr:translation initiation factor IF-2, chloroplastic-like [Cornus florida]XP_059662820.1 translation initiation factor IF-2, chloroplastic-like [Cornus florida]